MFRSTNKKRSNASATRVRRLAKEDDDDDGDGDANALNLFSNTSKKETKNKKRGVVSTTNISATTSSTKNTMRTSFAAAAAADDDDGDEGGDLLQRRSKKKKGGMGFGGGFSINDNISRDNDGEDDHPPSESPTLMAYDKDTLDRLKAEQTADVPTVAAAAAETEVPFLAPTVNRQQQAFAWDQPPAQPPMSYPQQPPPAAGPSSQQQVFPDFMPLLNNNNEEPTILTGAEALSFMQQQQGSTMAQELYEGEDDTDVGTFWDAQQQQQQQVPAAPEDERADNQAWEAEVVRRAGVMPSLDTAATNNTTADSSAAAIGANNAINLMVPTLSTDIHVSGKRLAILSHLKEQIQETLDHLKDQQLETERRIQRRHGEVETNESTIQRHEIELKEAGTALEFYQEWRSNLCLWVGALRDLRMKVEPILEALHELQGEKSALQRWRDWEDDIVSVLREHSMLECVIGRQPAFMDRPIVQNMVDEFGRDVKSQHGMQREKRRRHRQRILQQRQGRDDTCTLHANDLKGPTVDVRKPCYIRGDESDAFVSDGEEEVFRGRHKALQKALTIAVEELEEKYTLLQALVDLFGEWRREHPEEYKQCFASLSLADLASILVQTELCSLNDPWNESQGYNEAKWTTIVHNALETGVMDQPAVERLFEKCVQPAIDDILDKEGINLVSTRQTQSFATFVSHLQKLLPNESAVWKVLYNLLTSYSKKTLTEMAIPIIRKETSAHVHVPEESVEEVEEARNCTWGQMYRIKRVLCNLITHWAPIMHEDEAFIDIILHFTSNKFLFLLSSLNGMEQDDLAESPTDVFCAVYHALCQTGWLEYPEYLLLAAPIRAAAAAFGIECDEVKQATA